MALLLGIDTGGTYTDAVLFDPGAGADPSRIIAKAKAHTTHRSLEVGIGAAIDAVVAEAAIAPADIGLASVSTTLATNALVEGRGGRVGLVLIGMDDASVERGGLAQAIGDDPVIQIAGGHGPHGDRAAELDLAALDAGIEACGPVDGFAVVGEFAVRNPEHEVAVRDHLIARTGTPVTCGHELTAELNGPRRALTSVLNARLIGLIDDLLSATERLLAERAIAVPIMVVRGDGSLISLSMARHRPIETILSGPAASVVGARHLTDAQTALVSDIGGTTTDIAVLVDGQPTLTTEGAVVGGHRTMVRAVEMRTVGLGGDSEVGFDDSGAGTTLRLGPRRVLPVSLLATEHRDRVHGVLERQVQEWAVSEFAGAFVIRRAQPTAPEALPEVDQKLLAAIGDQPVALPDVLFTRREVVALDRLLALGLVMVSSFTPSDACHVLGRHDAWDIEAAEKAAAVFARRRDRFGNDLAPSGAALAQRVFDTVVHRSADTLLDAAFAADGRSAPDLSGHELVQSALRGAAEGAMVDIRLALRTPIVALGASASTYYPAVAERLGAPLDVPGDADVANALGAVVGQVRVTASATINRLEDGPFRVHLPDRTLDFVTLEDAAESAEIVLRDLATAQATEAGAATVETALDRADNVVELDGESFFVEASLTVTATGRPRLGDGVPGIA